MYVADKVVEFLDDVSALESGSPETRHSHQKRQKKPEAKKLSHRSDETEKLVLHVYGMSFTKIGGAMQDITTLCKDAKKQKTLTNTQIQEFVAKITHDQVELFCCT